MWTHAGCRSPTAPLALTVSDVPGQGSPAAQKLPWEWTEVSDSVVRHSDWTESFNLRDVARRGQTWNPVHVCVLLKP